MARCKFLFCKKDVYQELYFYCKSHACINCKDGLRLDAESLKKVIKFGNGFRVCGKRCWNSFLRKENKNEENILINFNEQAKGRLSAIWDGDFYEQIKNLINKLLINKCFVINSNIKLPLPPVMSLFSNEENFRIFKDEIDGSRVLSLQEKADWKNFYEKNKNEDIIGLAIEEEKFIAQLITKRREAKERLKKALENLDQERGHYAKKLVDLEGWDLLSADKQHNYLEQIKNSSLDSLESVLSKAQISIYLQGEREREQNWKIYPIEIYWLRIKNKGL
jgi:hypothetical protein